MKIKTALIFIIFFSSASNCFCWEKNVLISPLRIVIDNNKRTETAKIINPGDSKTTYRISLVSIDSDIYGVQKENNNPLDTQAKAIEILKFSPKKTTLLPGEIQTIRFFVKKPFDLEPGEYRTHLKISPLPDIETKEEAKNDKGLNIKLHYLISATIPIIIRHKSTFVSVNIEKAEINKNIINLYLSRTGTASALFDVEILNKNEIAGQRNRNAFYTPNTSLILPVELKNNFQKNDVLEIFIKNAENNDRFIYDAMKLNIF